MLRNPIAVRITTKHCITALKHRNMLSVLCIASTVHIYMNINIISLSIALNIIINVLLGSIPFGSFIIALNIKRKYSCHDLYKIVPIAITSL